MSKSKVHNKRRDVNQHSHMYQESSSHDLWPLDPKITREYHCTIVLTICVSKINLVSASQWTTASKTSYRQTDRVVPEYNLPNKTWLEGGGGCMVIKYTKILVTYIYTINFLGQKWVEDILRVQVLIHFFILVNPGAEMTKQNITHT